MRKMVGKSLEWINRKLTLVPPNLLELSMVSTRKKCPHHKDLQVHKSYFLSPVAGDPVCFVFTPAKEGEKEAKLFDCKGYVCPYLLTCFPPPSHGEE